MAQQIRTQTIFSGGISDFDKLGSADSVAWCRSIDLRTDPRSITLLPKTTKESGTVVTGLPKWADTVNGTTYYYADDGSLYSRTTAGVHTKLHTAPDSHGNGLSYYGEDDYLYYTTDNLIGRYGKLSDDSPQWTDDFLGAAGGVPTNTHSLDLEAGSTQYATAADSASLSITGDITLEAFFKPESLPASGSSMTLVAKWNESGATRSYKMDIAPTSNYFGDGSDGALTISSNTTEAPIDSACSGTSGAYSLTATNASFAANQIILIHQSQGTGAGTWQKNKILAYTAGTITLELPLNFSYATGAQVRVMKQYTTVTINAGITYTTKAWNGTVGGIMAFFCNSALAVNGTISAAGGKGTFLDNTTGTATGATGGGFRGGDSYNNGGNQYAQTGEGSIGKSTGYAAYGTGGGGGQYVGVYNYYGSDGGGGSNATAGTDGKNAVSGGSDHQGKAGLGATTIVGAADNTTMVFGGGGGGAVNDGRDPGSAPGEGVSSGGSGGGILWLAAVDITLGTNGLITAKGGQGGDCGSDAGGGGGGAGGCILLKYQTATLGTNKVIATGGDGSYRYTPTVGGTFVDITGGNGGSGYIHSDYYTSYTGTTSPTQTTTQDNNLGSSDGYSLRMAISNDGTATETKTYPIDITTGKWYRASVSWDQSLTTYTFYLNGVKLGTRTGTLVAIHNNTSLLSIGADYGSVAYQHYFDGLIDDIRIWSTERDELDILDDNLFEMAGTEGFLQAYYKLNNAATDATANANNLTLVGSPVYSTDVPFSGATTRLDIDQSDTGSGATYTLTAALDETSAGNRRTFVPAADPQKSVAVNIDGNGTGDWTLVVHDTQNREMASKTIVQADLVSSGLQEFVFSSVWRPVIGRTYHFHLYSTVADGTVVVDSGTPNSLADAQYYTYYNFLVNDEDFHPLMRHMNFLACGNERYLATWEGINYEPNKLTFPSGTRVRCLAFWREYLAIGIWRETNIYDIDEGRIYFWDGISDTFNFFIDVPEGAINAMLGSRGQLHVWAGYQGDHLIYEGGARASKIKRLPKITKDKYVEIFPGAITMWRTLLHYGVCGNSDSTEIERGVYSWGSLNVNYPDILTYDYPISTGNRTLTSNKVGMVHAVGRKLLIGWKDNISYGVDVVDSSGSPFAEGTVEILIKDDNTIYSEKNLITLGAEYEGLASGESISVKYKLDRASSWTTSTADSTADSENIRYPISPGRGKEYQIGINLLTTTTTSPKVVGLGLQYDDLKEEKSY